MHTVSLGILSSGTPPNLPAHSRKRSSLAPTSTGCTVHGAGSGPGGHSPEACNNRVWAQNYPAQQTKGFATWSCDGRDGLLHTGCGLHTDAVFEQVCDALIKSPTKHISHTSPACKFKGNIKGEQGDSPRAAAHALHVGTLAPQPSPSVPSRMAPARGYHRGEAQWPSM